MRPTTRITMLLTMAALMLAAPSNSSAAPAQNAVVGTSLVGDRVRVSAEELVLPSPISTRLNWARTHLAPTGLRKLEQIGQGLAPGIADGTVFPSLCGDAESGVAASFPGLLSRDVAPAAFLVLALATEDMDDDIRPILAAGDETAEAKRKLQAMIAELNQWISQEMAKQPGLGDINNQASGPSAKVVRSPGPSRSAALPLPGPVTLETRKAPVIRFTYFRVSAVRALPARDPSPSLGELRALRKGYDDSLRRLNELSAGVAQRLRVLLDRRSKLIGELSEMMSKASTTQEALVQNIK